MQVEEEAFMWDSSENSLKQSFPKGEIHIRDEPR